MADLFDKVRESAKFVAENNKVVKINEAAIETFLDNLKETDINEKAAVTVFPLKFDSTDDEINFVALIDLLNFGSGFRQELHHALERGAYESICFGAMAMYLTNGGKLDAEFMKNVSIVDVGNYFNLPLSKEVALQPGLYTYQPSPLKPLAEKLKSVLNETGSILLSKGYSTLGAFILDVTKPQPDSPPTATRFVKALVDTFPAFNDKSAFQGKDVYIIKKAMLLAADLYLRYKDSLATRFDFVDIERIPAVSDNVLAAVLRHYGILEFSDELKAHIDEKKELTDTEWEAALRLTAIHACELIAQSSAQRSVNYIPKIIDLSNFLWTKGKDGDFRKVERHATKNTIFY